MLEVGRGKDQHLLANRLTGKHAICRDGHVEEQRPARALDLATDDERGPTRPAAVEPLALNV